VLIHDPRATKTELRKGAVKSEIERDPRNRGTRAKREDQRWDKLEARMWGNEDEENWTKGRGKETEWKHIENKSGKPWRISTEAWK